MPMNPDHCCAICGRKLTNGHRCSEKTLRGIDASHKRDPDDMLEYKKPFYKRLKDGFALMEGKE